MVAGYMVLGCATKEEGRGRGRERTEQRVERGSGDATMLLGGSSSSSSSSEGSPSSVPGAGGAGGAEGGGRIWRGKLRAHPLLRIAAPCESQLSHRLADSSAQDPNPSE